MIYVLFVLVLLIGLIALACGILIAQVIQQNGRMLLRIEAVEQYLSGGGRDPYDLDDYLDTLPAGVAAPPIELPDLTGPMKGPRRRRAVTTSYGPNPGVAPLRRAER